MDNEQAKELASKFWSFIRGKNWDKAHALLAPEFEAYRPQSNEKFNRDTFIEMNRIYPGTHEIQVMNIWCEEDQWDRIATVISEVFIKSKTPSGEAVESNAISIFEIEEDGECLIRTVREYWARTYPVPDWRKHLSTPYSPDEVAFGQT